MGTDDPEFSMFYAMAANAFVGGMCLISVPFPLIPSWMGGSAGAFLMAWSTDSRGTCRGDVLRVLGTRVVSLCSEGSDVVSELHVPFKSVVVAGRVMDRLLIFDHKHRVQDRLGRVLGFIYARGVGAIRAVQQQDDFNNNNNNNNDNNNNDNNNNNNNNSQQSQQQTHRDTPENRRRRRRGDNDNDDDYEDSFLVDHRRRRRRGDNDNDDSYENSFFVDYSHRRRPPRRDEGNDSLGRRQRGQGGRDDDDDEKNYDDEGDPADVNDSNQNRNDRASSSSWFGRRRRWR